MLLDDIIINVRNRSVYGLSNSVSDYMEYIVEEPFYVSPEFEEICNDVNENNKAQFLLFSAPGATGKSALAKFISYKHSAIYWDLAKVKLGVNSFVGSIVEAIGSEKYSMFINELKEGEIKLIIDALDEADMISGSRMLNNFIKDIWKILSGNCNDSVILLSRTETAQQVAAYCKENNIYIKQYEIGYFTKNKALEFIALRGEKVRRNQSWSQLDDKMVSELYETIAQHLGNQEIKTFLGYAPVLEAISEYAGQNANTKILINKIRDISGHDDASKIIMSIMTRLLEREQEKVVEAFKKKVQGKQIGTLNWDKIYAPREQLARIILYLAMDSTEYSEFNTDDDLLPSMIDDYNEILCTFLQQHPFISIHKNEERPSFTGPAFRDYALAKIMLDRDFEYLVGIYFDCFGKDSSPSPLYFDYYKELSSGIVYAEHLSYLYSSYRAKQVANEMVCLACFSEEDSPASARFDIFGKDDLYTGKQGAIFKIKSRLNEENIHSIYFSQLHNVNFDLPEISLDFGSAKKEFSITSSFVDCRKISWRSENVVINSYPPNGVGIITHENSDGSPSFEINAVKRICISMPDLRRYYSLYEYKTDFDTINVNDEDEIRFRHAIYCLLIEFRTHSKDTLAKAVERIDNVVIGSNLYKRKVLEFLKSKKIIYEEGPLYKVNLEQMKYNGISFVGLNSMSGNQLKKLLNEFVKFIQEDGISSSA